MMKACYLLLLVTKAQAFAPQCSWTTQPSSSHARRVTCLESTKEKIKPNNKINNDREDLPPKLLNELNGEDDDSSSSSVIYMDTSSSTIDEELVKMIEAEALCLEEQGEECQIPVYGMDVPMELEGHEEQEALRLLSSELGVRRALDKPVEPTLPLNTVIDRTLDTVEDVVMHLRRKPYDLGMTGDQEQVSNEADTRETIVILGSGWGSHALMKVIDSYRFRVIVVSPTNHFLFTPMLASASVGTVEFRSMTETVRASNPMVDYIEGGAQDVDLERKVITVKQNSLLKDIHEGEPPMIEIPYDKLVVATGVKVADAHVPGADKCLKLKTCEDAKNLRVNVAECLEYASRRDVRDNTPEARRERSRRVTFLIVGGGPTGVELAGEMADFVKDITREKVGQYPNLKDSVRVILCHGGPQVLQQFEPQLRDEALKSLKKQGVEVILNTKVTQVRDTDVQLSTKQFDSNGNIIGTKEEVLPVGLKVWAAGTAPVPFVNTLREKLPQEAHGYGGKINVDKWLRVQTGNPQTFGSVLVLGDAAAFKESSYSNDYLPQTAQVAGQQGAFAGRLLCRGYDLSATPPELPEFRQEGHEDCARRKWLEARGLEKAPGFNFLNLGLLAYVGGGEALTQVQFGDVNVFSYAGSMAFVLWRSVYLVKQVASRNRVLITFDWLKTALFGRDVTRL